MKTAELYRINPAGDYFGCGFEDCGGVEWLRRIKKLRIEGELGRKYPPVFVVGRGYKIKVKPDVKFDRDRYFNNLFG